jgi:predicted Zn-dependent protease
LISFILTGCSGGSYAISIGQLTSSSNSISGEYRSFSGYYFKEVTFEKGDAIHFNYSVSTKKGTFSAKLMNSSGREVNEIRNDQTIEITKTDQYKVRVEGKKHKGSFYLSWNKVVKK